MKPWLRNSCIGLACLAAAPVAAPVEAQPSVWDAVRDGGHVIVMRHALAPGTGA